MLSTPIGLALSSDNLLYVIDKNGGIFVFDPVTLTQMNANAPGFNPTAIVCPRDATKVYVAGSLPSFEGIAVFRRSAPGWLILDNGSQMRPYNQLPNIMAISPSDGRIFAGHTAGDYLTIWEPTNDQYGLTQVGVLEAVQFNPKGIAFSPDGTRIFVVGDGNQLHVFDYDTLKPTGPPATLNTSLIAIASTFDGTRLLASDGQSLSVIVPSEVSGGVGG